MYQLKLLLHHYSHGNVHLFSSILIENYNIFLSIFDKTVLGYRNVKILPMNGIMMYLAVKWLEYIL